MRASTLLIALALTSAAYGLKKTHSALHHVKPSASMAEALKKLSHHGSFAAGRAPPHVRAHKRAFKKLQEGTNTSSGSGDRDRNGDGDNCRDNDDTCSMRYRDDLSLYNCPRCDPVWYNETCSSADFGAAMLGSGIMTSCSQFQYADDSNISTVMSQFCSSQCKTDFASLLPSYRRCMDFEILDMLDKCDNSPTCMSSSYFDAWAGIQVPCQNFDADALFELNDATTEARAAATAACGNTECIDAAKALVRDYPDCVDRAMRFQVVTAVDVMCSTSGSDICANNLKDAFFLFSGCSRLWNQSSCSADSRCVWEEVPEYSWGYCEAVITSEALAPICGSCFGALIDAFEDHTDGEIEEHRRAVALRGGEAVLANEAVTEIRARGRQELEGFTSLRDLFCTQIGGVYCYPLVMSTVETVNLDRLFNITPGARTYTQANADQDTMCANATIRGCTNRILGVAFSQGVRSVQSEMKRCSARASTGQYTQDSQGQWTYSNSGAQAYTTERAAECAADADRSLAELAESNAMLEFMCKKSAEQRYCVSMMHHLMTDDTTGCMMSIIGSNTPDCTGTGCDTWAANVTDWFGCCKQELTTIFTNNSRAYDVGLIPAVQIRNSTGSLNEQVVTPAPRVRAQVAWDDHPMRPFSYCTSLNNTAFETNSTTVCPPAVGSMPTKTLVMRILWNAVQNDPALKARLEASLATDLSNALSIPIVDIVNGTIYENNGETLTVIAAAGSRRQSESESQSSSEYRFAIGGNSQEDADRASADYDQQVEDGTLNERLTTTSSTIDEEPELTQGVEGAGDGSVFAASPSSASALSTAVLALVALVALLF